MQIVSRLLFSVIFFLAITTHAFAREKDSIITGRDFRLNVLDKNMQQKRTGLFLPTLTEPKKKQIRRLDPGASGHLTVLIEDNILIRGETEALDSLLNTPGAFVFVTLPHACSRFDRCVSFSCAGGEDPQTRMGAVPHRAAPARDGKLLFILPALPERRFYSQPA
jgi:hypothetical protein